MSYKPINWVDHTNSGNKYKLTDNSDGTTTIDYARKVIQQGTPLSAENLNHMEQGILENSQQLESKVDKVDGKGLSANDFTEAYKKQIESNTSALGGHTVGINVPLNALFTDRKVSQQSSDVDQELRLLLSYSANQTSEEAIAKKCSKLTANPYTGEIKATTFKTPTGAGGRYSELYAGNVRHHVSTSDAYAGGFSWLNASGSIGSMGRTQIKVEI